jgi:hypothetical protein
MDKEWTDSTWETSECYTTKVTDDDRPTKPGELLRLLSALQRQQTHTIYNVDGGAHRPYVEAITTELGYTLCDVRWKHMLHKHPLTEHDSMILATKVEKRGKQLAKRVTQLQLPGAAWVADKYELRQLTEALQHRQWEYIRRWGEHIRDPQWISWGFNNAKPQVVGKSERQWARSEELLHYVHIVRTDRARDRQEVARVHEYSKTMLDPTYLTTMKGQDNGCFLEE